MNQDPNKRRSSERNGSGQQAPEQAREPEEAGREQVLGQVPEREEPVLGQVPEREEPGPFQPQEARQELSQHQEQRQHQELYLGFCQELYLELNLRQGQEPGRGSRQSAHQ